MQMRLDKILAHYGVGTRKEVKKYIRKGFVEVNDIVIKEDDFKSDPDKDVIKFDGEVINYQQYVYLMLNKPDNCVCATKDQLHTTVIDLIEGYENYDLFPVGRLDKDTKGLLLITNDGDFAHKLMSPSRHHSKVYYALIDSGIDQSDVTAFKSGVDIGDYKCKPANLTILETNTNQSKVHIEIFEGKFHQIKRMFHALGKEVIYLKRLKIKNLELDKDLDYGDYRELTDDEIIDLKKDL